MNGVKSPQTPAPDYGALAERLIVCFTEKGIRVGESIHPMLTKALANKEDERLEQMRLAIVRCFPEEYEAGRTAVRMMKEEMGDAVPSTAALSVAVALIEAQYGVTPEETLRLIEFIWDVNSRILSDLGMTPNQNPKGYVRYLTHLKHFAHRVATNYHYNDDVTSLADSFSDTYSREMECSKRIGEFISQRYHYNVGRDELLYLTLHLAILTHKR